jgi:putative membrane protein
MVAHAPLAGSFQFTLASLSLLAQRDAAVWRPDSFGMALLSTLGFGLIGLVLALLGYKLFDWITPRLHVEHELSEKHNIAVAIVIAAVIIGSCIVVAATIVG